MAKERKHEAVAYGDETTFYINDRAGTAVPVLISTKNYNKGWEDVYVGAYTAKARQGNANAVAHDLLSKHYPGHDQKRSFYADLSYNSALNQGVAGKSEVYGVDSPYMVNFSLYKPMRSYRLLYPVKTSAPGSFGKTRNKLTEYEWEYVVNNWHPMGDGSLEWSVKHVVKYPDGTEKTLYQSPRMSNPDEALVKYNERVVMAGGKPYRVPKRFEGTGSTERLGRLRSGKLKRTTGRKRTKGSAIGLKGLRR